MSLSLIPVQPIAKRSSTVLACPGGKLVTFEENVYPPSEHGGTLRQHRVGYELSLRETAKLLGLKAVDLSALEAGRATLSHDDWVRAFDALHAAFVGGAS